MAKSCYLIIELSEISEMTTCGEVGEDVKTKLEEDYEVEFLAVRELPVGARIVCGSVQTLRNRLEIIHDAVRNRRRLTSQAIAEELRQLIADVKEAEGAVE